MQSVQSQNSHFQYIDVFPLSGIGRALVYKTPDNQQNQQVKPGFLVKIPLMRRTALGVVVNTGVKTTVPESKIKPIQEVLYDLPVLSKELIELAEWLSGYYGASLESVFETMIPAAIRNGMSAKALTYIALSEAISDEKYQILKKKAPKQAELYDFLRYQQVPIEKGKALKRLGIGVSSCDALIKQGIVEETKSQVTRVAYDDLLATAEQVDIIEPQLTAGQSEAVADICESLDKQVFQPHLLHGVTGSGKTEVYLRAILKAIEAGGSVIFLVSEVALTPQTVGRLRARLNAKGIDVVVWHSHLSEGERYDAWMAMLKGEARVVVGARSAIFAPMRDLRLIIVDEEHEPAYKQAEMPRYHGRDVAVYRAKLCNAVCVLGSATPSLESLNNVNKRGYKLNLLRERVDDRKLPLVHIVDMKRELLHTKGQVLVSRMLIEKMRERLEKGEQSILFLNRRGYLNSMLCPDCGFVMECPQCSVTLTYHRTDERLRCHMCGHDQKMVSRCPSCRSDKVRWRGSGTQRVEEIIQKAMPNARVIRMDADTMSKKNLFREILADFRKGKIDVLIGTQMIAKGLDFPNVTLVGLIDADISLHMQDFRAGERTFQLVVQVSGRAGRGDLAGEVVIQSYAPASAPIQYARRGDFEGFLAEEMEMRKEYHYPPFRNIIRHIFKSKNKEKLAYFIEQWAKLVEKELADDLELRGPAPAPLEKIKNYYRYHLWFFTHNVSRLMPKLLALREQFGMDKDIQDMFDTDPIDLS